MFKGRTRCGGAPMLRRMIIGPEARCATIRSLNIKIEPFVHQEATGGIRICSTVRTRNL